MSEIDWLIDDSDFCVEDDAEQDTNNFGYR